MVLADVFATDEVEDVLVPEVEDTVVVVVAEVTSVTVELGGCVVGSPTGGMKSSGSSRWFCLSSMS